MLARFLMMGSVVSLITVLMVMLSGLSVGLVNDGVSGLQKLPVNAFAFEDGISRDSAFSRSIVQLDDAKAWKQQSGVDDAVPFGNTLVNGHNQKQKPVDLALFGVEADSSMAPTPSEGDALGSQSNQAVVSPTLKDQGVRLGDVITLDRVGTELKVVGFLPDQATFGHVDVAYTTLDTWQEVKAGTRPGETVPASARTEVTAIAVAGADIDLDTAAKATGTEPMPLKQSYGASPGYTAETSTLILIQVFLYAISALVVGAFFTVWTIQRKKEIAVLRATGAPTSYVLRDSLTQALLLLLGSVAAGLAVGYGLGAMISSTAMPFALEFGAVALAAVLLIALGLLGALAAVVRIVRIDPLNALGDQR